MQDGTRYLTVQEIADQLRVKKQTVWRWIRAGKLSTLRVGKEYRISPADYQAFLERYHKPPK